MPPVKNPSSQSQRPAHIDIRNRPRIPIPDEDPYSIAGSGSSGASSGNGGQANGSGGSGGNTGGNGSERSRDKPPKLPPRDNNGYSANGMPKPDYEHMDDQRFQQQQMERGKQSKKDDPYYCGLRARIPNFAKTKAQKEKEAARYAAAAAAQQAQPPAVPPSAATGGPLPPGHPMMWHRGYLDNVPHHTAMPGYGHTGAGFARNGRPFERNPTTWVPQAPLCNAVSEWESYWQN